MRSALSGRKISDMEILRTDLGLVESPRWHQGR